jgi:serine O-acetyltransferase
MVTGIEIHPGATLGRRVFIDHGMGVVIGETAEIGDDCTIYQGVTLGGTALTRGAKRHPTLGRGVIVGANSQVLGGFLVGDGARVGSGAVVVKPVPPGATAVGNPARILLAEDESRREAAAARMGFSAYGITQGDDPVAQALRSLIDNASGHEHQIALLWQAIETLSQRTQATSTTGELTTSCIPQDAATTEIFDADRLNRLVK